MSPEIKKHVHKYERRILGGRRIEHYLDDEGKRKRKIVKGPGTEIFKCVFPGCQRYLLREMAIDERTICWRCGEELVLTREALNLKHPTHKECRKKRLPSAENDENGKENQLEHNTSQL
jgi:hypothetical protein